MWTNPYDSRQIKPFLDFFLTNRIDKSNLLKIASQIESTNPIFWKPYRFANIKVQDLFPIVRLCTKDSWGFIGFVESFEISVTNQIDESNLLKTGSQIFNYLTFKKITMFWNLPHFWDFSIFFMSWKNGYVLESATFVRL